MKKLIFAILFISIGNFTYGQYVPKGKTSKAETALDQGKLDIAKAEIDEAFKIDNKGKVSAAAKNWFLKGNIYKSLYLDDSSSFKDLVGPEGLNIAMECFSKVKSMGKENSSYVIFADQQINNLYNSIINKGASAYNDNDYESAYKAFGNALKVIPGDTTALLYGAVSAQQAEMFDESLDFYQMMADNGTAKVENYKTMIFIYRNEKDDLESVLRVVTQGIEAFPQNKDLIQEKITTLIMLERADDAKSELEAAISNDPTNSLYYYFLGYLYDIEENSEKAVEQYEKAIELNPDYYDANYNLGVVHYNVGRDLLSELNNLSLADYRLKEEDYVKRSNVHFEKSLPYFEKAVELNPDEEIQLLETLQGVYLRLKMTEKAEVLEKKIKELTGI